MTLDSFNAAPASVTIAYNIAHC